MVTLFDILVHKIDILDVDDFYLYQKGECMCAFNYMNIKYYDLLILWELFLGVNTKLQ